MFFRLAFGARRSLIALAIATAASMPAGAFAFANSPFGPAVAAVRQAGATDDLTTGNQLALIENGYDALLLRVHLIRHATSSIAIQTFIWTNDECGRLLIYELVEAARRGVKVRILADHMFSDQDPDIVAFLATVHPNFEVKHYRPATSRMKSTLLGTVLAGLRSFRDVNQRMHNKVMLVDGAVLVTGGRNVENTYFDHSTGMNFRDRDVLAIGPVVRAAAESFEDFWRYRHSIPSRALKDVDAAIAANAFRRYDTRDAYDFGPHFAGLDREADDAALIGTRFAARLKPVRKAAFICDEPGKSFHARGRIARITHELRGTLERARHSVVMQTPYLVLSKPARSLFREIQERNPGLKIRISTNSFASTDNIMAYSANYRLRNEYVEELKLQIYEFKPQPDARDTLFPRHALMTGLARAAAGASEPDRLPFLCLHAKSLVVDDAIAFVGSYNLDPRSENLNTEVGFLVEDEAFARELRTAIEADMQPGNSWVIARRPLPLRLDVVNGLVEGLLSLSPIDVWPIQNTSSYELRPGHPPVPIDDPAFHEHYRDVGSFPGTDGPTTKETLTRLYKAVGAPLTPVL